MRQRNSTAAGPVDDDTICKRHGPEHPRPGQGGSIWGSVKLFWVTGLRRPSGKMLDADYTRGIGDKEHIWRFYLPLGPTLTMVWVTDSLRRLRWRRVGGESAPPILEIYPTFSLLRPLEALKLMPVAASLGRPVWASATPATAPRRAARSGAGAAWTSARTSAAVALGLLPLLLSPDICLAKNPSIRVVDGDTLLLTESRSSKTRVRYKGKEDPLGSLCLCSLSTQ